MNKNVLTISHFDPSCGTGVSADLKTFQACRVYGTAVITALTVQNSERLESVIPIPPEVVKKQLEAIFSDMSIDAVKTGLLASEEMIRTVADFLSERALENVVVDPVLEIDSKGRVAEGKRIALLKEKMLPPAKVVTPNLFEASCLSGREVRDVPSMKEAAKEIYAMGASSVIVKGGDLDGKPRDVFYDGTSIRVFEADRSTEGKSRGAGCTFSSFLAALLARNIELSTAAEKAKRYIEKGMNHPFDIGKGESPLNHNVVVGI